MSISSSPFTGVLDTMVPGSIFMLKVLWMTGMTGMVGSGLAEALEQSDVMWGEGVVVAIVMAPG